MLKCEDRPCHWNYSYLIGLIKFNNSIDIFTKKILHVRINGGRTVDKWCVETCHLKQAAVKKLNKKHQKELASCTDNLDRVLEILNEGNAFGSFRFNFLRNEFGQVHRVGQSEGSAETRLYIYIYVHGKTIYLLNAGLKSTQQKDLKEVKIQTQELEKELGIK